MWLSLLCSPLLWHWYPILGIKSSTKMIHSLQFLNFAWMNHYLRFLTCCDKSVYLEISIIFYSEHTLGSKECICFKIFAKQVISWIGIESKYSKSSRQSESFDKTNFNFPSISNSNFSKEGSRFRRRSLRLSQHL